MSVFKTYKPLSLTLEPKNPAGFSDLLKAAHKLSERNVSIAVNAVEDARLIILSGYDEDSLDAFCSTLRKKTEQPFSVGQPLVNYRCALPEARKHKYRYKFISSVGTGFIDFLILFEPGNLRGDISLRTDLLEFNPDEAYESAFSLGLSEVHNSVGFPLFDFKATLLSLDYEVRDNNPDHFFGAARRSLLDAYSKDEFVSIEPMLEAIIDAPDKYLDDLKTDLIARRGHIDDCSEDNGIFTLKAYVPMSNMFGYENSLRAMTNSEGNFKHTFSHFSRLINPVGYDPDTEPAITALKLSRWMA